MDERPPTDSTSCDVDSALCAQLESFREALLGLPNRLVGVSSHVLASLAASAAGVVAAAEAARAAVVLEAHSRGVINASDHPRTRDWVEQSCKEAGVPVVKAHARQLQDITTDCDGYDLLALRAAVTEGRVPMDAAANVAKVFRRLKKKTNYSNWDKLLQILIDWAAGEDSRGLATIEDWCLSQYGTEEALDDEHATLYEQRTVAHFRRDRAGMLSATVKFDPASEAVFTAALQSLSKPQPNPNGTLDPRSPGQRRADALLTMARLSTRPDKDIPRSGSTARVTVTISFSALKAGLDLGDHLGECADARCSASANGDNTQCCADAASAGDPEHARHGVAGYGQILSPREARMLACDAEIIPADPRHQGSDPRLRPIETPHQPRIAGLPARQRQGLHVSRLLSATIVV